MSENSNHDTHPYAPAAQKIPQASGPSGSGVRLIPNPRHNSIYSISNETPTSNGAAMTSVSASEQYHYQHASGSTPRTAYSNGISSVASYNKWSGPNYYQIPYTNHGDNENTRHIASPVITSHGQYPQAQAWGPTRSMHRQPPLQDPNYAHPNRTNHSPYTNNLPYSRPPHHPVEPNAAAPSPPTQYPNSPRTPQAMGNQLPPTNGLTVPTGHKQSVSSIGPVAAMPSTINGNIHQEIQQEQQREYRNQHADSHHHPNSERTIFAEPVHDSPSKYSPSQANRLINTGGARRLSGMDMRLDGRDRITHQFGAPAPSSQSNYYSSSSPLSPGAGLGTVRDGNPNFGRGYQYHDTHGGYRFDNKGTSERGPSEEHPYLPGSEARFAGLRPSAAETRKTSPQKNPTLSNGHSNHQGHNQGQRHDDTDEEDEIKRETISRTASASISPTGTRCVIPRARRDSIDSICSNGSGKEGTKKRGGPVFADSTGKQYYEEDVIPPGIEIPQGWQLGAGKKCLNKLLPLFKDGLPVFPEWGLTSAGKARQRLPKACASCRTKKIKCVESDQDDTKCAHCHKMRIACSQDDEEKPTRKNSKKVSEKKKKRDGTIDRDSGAGGSASPAVLHLNSVQGGPVFQKKRKASDDSQKRTSLPKRGKPSRDSSFSMEPIGEKTSNSMDSSGPLVRHQPPQTQTTPVQGQKRLTFATHEPAALMSVTDEGMTSRSYNSRLLAGQYPPSGYAMPGKQISPVMGTPPNTFTSDSPATSDHPTIHGINSYAPSSKGMSATPTLMSTSPLSYVPQPLGEDPRNSNLPPRPVLEHLVDVYFKYVYSQTYAFLHRETFIETLDKQPPVLLFSLCTVAARFSENFRKHEEDFAVHARKLIFENYDNNCVEVVQSMIHMGLHDFGSNKGDKAWMFCGMAVRMGTALNLNLENGRAKMFLQSPVSREAARRTFWSYYLMDRFNSYGVARPFLTQDHDCHVQLPCNQPSFRDGKVVVTEHLLGPNPSNPTIGTTYMGALAFLVRVVGIWGNILKQIHLSGFEKDNDKEKQFNSLTENLERWRKALPRGLEYSNENLAGQIKVGTAGAFVTMHVMWHTAMAYVHRYVRTISGGESRGKANPSLPDNNIIQSIRKTFVHADAVLLIMSHVQQKRKVAQGSDREVDVNAPFLGQAISDACEISAIRAMKLKGELSNVQDQKDRIFVGLGWLKELRQYWKPLEGMYNKLRRTCRTLNVERSTSQPLSSRASNIIPSPDSGNGSELISGYPMFQFPLDPTIYDLQPDIGMGSLPVSASMGTPQWHSVPESYYETAFTSSNYLLYEIAEAEGGFPQLYLDPTVMRDGMDPMATTLAPSDVSYQTDIQGHTVLDPSPIPQLPHQSFDQITTNRPNPQDHHDDSDDDSEDEKEVGEDEDEGSVTYSRKREANTSISTLYFHPIAVLDGKLGYSSGSESSGQESRRQSEAAPKPETNRMDVLNLLVSTKVTKYVSKAIEKRDRSDLGTGRLGAMVPDDGSLTGEVSTDNSKDHH